MESQNNKKELEVMKYLSKGDKFVFYIFRKSSKISYAIYAITDLIKDSEPLKWTLRKTATEVSSVYNFFDEKSVFNSLERTLLELENFLSLASFAKVVSEMNASLLQSEIVKLIVEMRERSKDGFYSPELVSTFFDIPKPETFNIAPVMPAPEPDDFKGHKRQGVRYDFYKKADKATSSQNKNVAHVEQKVNIPTKGQRRDEIISIIRQKGGVGVSIKDIAERVKDCSEKTIQRELVAMVSDNTLIKTGERRWSTYSLKS